MPNIAVVGSISMDLVAVSKKRPKAGETVIGEAFHTIPGGKGANQAVAAARLGANVAMVGAVGNDNYGTVVREQFRERTRFYRLCGTGYRCNDRNCSYRFSRRR